MIKKSLCQIAQKSARLLQCREYPRRNAGIEEDRGPTHREPSGSMPPHRKMWRACRCRYQRRPYLEQRNTGTASEPTRPAEPVIMATLKIFLRERVVPRESATLVRQTLVLVSAQREQGAMVIEWADSERRGSSFCQSSRGRMNLAGQSASAVVVGQTPAIRPCRRICRVCSQPELQIFSRSQVLHRVFKDKVSHVGRFAAESVA